jgi:hypothetical protein
METLKFASTAAEAMKAPLCRAQLHTELDADLSGRIVGAPEPGQQAAGRRDNRGRGFFKGLVGPLRDGRAILSQATHDRAARRVVDLDENAAPVLEGIFDQTFH